MQGYKGVRGTKRAGGILKKNFYPYRNFLEDYPSYIFKPFDIVTFKVRF